MECKRCGEVDVSLVEYVEIESGIFDVSLECRQCGYISVDECSEKELNLYR